jgi:putative redox protein
MAEVLITDQTDLQTSCLHVESGEKIVTDAPKEYRGKGEFFSPTDLVAAALGSCILTVMKIVAARLNVSLEGTTVHVTKEMETRPLVRIKKFIVVVSCPTHFEEKVQKELEKGGLTCPVHHSLHPEIEQEIRFLWGEGR